jgi:hypothetical protein
VLPIDESLTAGDYGISPDRYLVQSSPIIVNNEYNVYRCFTCDTAEHKYYFIPTKLKMFSAYTLYNTEKRLDLVYISTVDYEVFWEAKENLKLYDIQGNLHPLATRSNKLQIVLPDEILSPPKKRKGFFKYQTEIIQNLHNDFQSVFLLRLKGKDEIILWKKYLSEEVIPSLNFESDTYFYAYDELQKKVKIISIPINISIFNLKL